jgi:glycosyltransferase involved in cell wall biosynthesis
VGTYGRHLVAALAERRRDGEELLGFMSNGPPVDPEVARSLDRLVTIPGPSRGITFLDGWRLPRLLTRQQVQIFHSLFYALPSRPVPGVLLVQTVHDLTPLLLPGGFTLRQRMVFRAALRRATRAHRVVAVSENTRDDLVRILGLHLSSVEVIHPGMDPIFFQPPRSGRIDELRDRIGLDGPYWIHSGGYDPVKNLPQVLGALARLRAEGCSHRLLVTGNPGPHASAFAQEVERHGLQGAVVQSGWVEVEDLACLYRGAEVMVYPSRYEGFGFPPLEAMACGTAAVAGRAGSMPEVLGGVCPLVDPDDTEELTDALRCLLADPGLRAETSRRGRERAAGFRWEAAADRTWEMYRGMLAASGSPS